MKRELLKKEEYLRARERTLPGFPGAGRGPTSEGTLFLRQLFHVCLPGILPVILTVIFPMPSTLPGTQ